MLMRFVEIRKFSGSVLVLARPFGVSLMPASEKWEELHYSGGEGPKKRSDSVYKTLPE